MKRKKRKLNYFRIAILVLILLIVIELIALLIQSLIMLGSNSDSTIETTPETTTGYAEPTPDPRRLNNYDYDSYQNYNGILYYEDDNYTSELGIDVSAHQTYIDWDAAVNDGVTFAIIRAGYRGYESGLLNEDDRFRENMENALEAGLEVGVYFFTQAITEKEAVEEAEYVLYLIQDYNVKGPVAFDMELSSDHDRINELTVDEKTAIAKAFVKTIADAGYKPMIYGSADWLMMDYHLEELQDECSLWVANYSTKALPYAFEYEIWQYHCGGIVEGIDADVDLNIRMVSKN